MLFFSSSRSVELASHDAVVRPTMTGAAVLRTGPVLPDVRIKGTGMLGVDIRLDKTDATSTDELVRRYGYIAGQPEGQIAKVGDVVADMLGDAALRGAVAGLVPIAIWLLVGRSRRREIAARIGPPQLLIGLGAGSRHSGSACGSPGGPTGSGSPTTVSGSRSRSSWGRRCRCPTVSRTSRSTATSPPLRRVD